MNICIFSGRLTRDCEVRYTQSGKSCGAYDLAVESGYGENKKTAYVHCVHWNVENISPYLTKGKAVLIQGRYQDREYTGKDGAAKRRSESIVRHLEFQQGTPKGEQAAAQPAQPDQPMPLTAGDYDSDIPF